MATLLLRLAAPLQSWGADSKFETRKTNREPTKSGVIGLLAAALGLRRDDAAGLARLNGLHFAVRADREGSLLVDFHTANREENRKKGKAPYVTYRHYLQDAVFLVGLESEDTALLQELETALKHPVYPLYLGRRSCPPTLPLCLGIRAGKLLDTLWAEPLLVNRGMGPPCASWQTRTRRMLLPCPGVIWRCRSVPSTGSTASARCGSGTQTRRKCPARPNMTQWQN